MFELHAKASEALQDYHVRRSKREVLNIMVVGEAGLGKTTAITNLFGCPTPRKSQPTAQAIATPTLQMESYPLIGHSEGANTVLDMEITDTPGYGDHTNINTNVNGVVTELRARHRKYALIRSEPARIVPRSLHARIDESDPRRDPRVHLVLYFVAPHRFKPVDKEFVAQLSRYANVAIVSAKADTMTEAEIAQYKIYIKDELDRMGSRMRGGNIHNGHFLFGSEGEPFAVIAENRKYLFCSNPAECENPTHSDFPRLREEVLGQKMEEYKDGTDKLFERLYHSGELRCAWYQAAKTYLGSAMGIALAELLFLNQQQEPSSSKDGSKLTANRQLMLLQGALIGTLLGAVLHTVADRL